MRRTWGPLMLVLVAFAVAQAHAGGGIRLPRIFDPPPPPRAQIAEAEIFDPYPIPYMAPINDGSRPRDFLFPPPQATRGRWPNPGTFPRKDPWLRSSAPVDYPNISKWQVPGGRKAQLQAGGPVIAPAEVERVEPAEDDADAPPAEKVKAPPAAKASSRRAPSRAR